MLLFLYLHFFYFHTLLREVLLADVYKRQSVRHLGTDVNYIVLENLYNQLKDKIEIHFHTHIDAVEKLENGYRLVSRDKSFTGSKCIISTGRSGSKWMGSICKSLGIATKSNRVDIGVRVELPYSIFSDLTDELDVYKRQVFSPNSASSLRSSLYVW